MVGWLAGMLTPLAALLVLAAGIGGAAFPSLQLAYITQPGFDQRVTLYLHDLTHKLTIVLRDDLIGWGLDIAWSPDGRLIAYSSYHQDAAYRSLYVMDLLTGGVRRISPEDVDSNSPTWSPDGQQIIYQAYIPQTGWDIYRYDLRTGTAHLVVARPGTDGNPAWSPDGRRIVFESTYIGGQADIYLYDLESRAIDRLTDDFSNETNAVWLPDGEAIVFASRRGGGAYALWQMHLRDRDLFPLTDGDSATIEPSISPGGQWVAYVDDRHAGRQLVVQRLDDPTVRRRISGLAAILRQPAFRP
ncbi:MAG: hypothetical protein ACOCXZ_00290 [Chloroflexota bacterium]